MQWSHSSCNCLAWYCPTPHHRYVSIAVTAALSERLRSGKGQVLRLDPVRMAVHYVSIDTYMNWPGGSWDAAALGGPVGGGVAKPGASSNGIDLSKSCEHLDTLVALNPHPQPGAGVPGLALARALWHMHRCPDIEACSVHRCPPTPARRSGWLTGPRLPAVAHPLAQSADTTIAFKDGEYGHMQAASDREWRELVDALWDEIKHLPNADKCRNEWSTITGRIGCATFDLWARFPRCVLLSQKYTCCAEARV